MLKIFSLFLGIVILCVSFYSCGSDDENGLTKDSEPLPTNSSTPTVPNSTDVPPVAPKDFGAAPAFQIPDLEGQQVSLADFAGQVVAVNFWATWCAPCRREVPEFVEVQTKHQDKGFTIIGISRDTFPDDEKVVRDFVKQFKINYPVLEDTQNVFVHAYNGFAMPSTFILDRNHNIRFKHIGIVDKVTLEAEVSMLLNE